MIAQIETEEVIDEKQCIEIKSREDSNCDLSDEQACIDGPYCGYGLQSQKREYVSPRNNERSRKTLHPDYLVKGNLFSNSKTSLIEKTESEVA